MGKLIVLFFALLLLPSVLAFNIAYVVKTPFPLNSDETAIKNLLAGDGYSVTVLDDVPFNADLYNMIIVGDDVGSINSIFDIKNHKTLFLSDTAAKYAGLSKYNGETSGNRITISDNGHAITEGFSLGDLTVYPSSENINYIYGCKAINSESLAYKTYTYKSVLLTLKEDSLLLDSSGSCSKRNVPIYERNAFFGLSEASYWNSNAEALFLRSIDWLLYGEDDDGDGYYYDEDCDDNNADIWQNIEGYVDSDEDGYGTGSLIEICSGNYLAEGYSEINGDCNDLNNEVWQLLEGYLDNDNDGFGSLDLVDVCSGDNLLEGYSEIDGDCNDGNSSINPEGEEIPYNSIDEDCDGYDLLDVDNDGYCKLGYNIVNKNVQCSNELENIGTDCDDLDEEINPGSEDVYKNCRNDAPIVEEISKIIVYETETVEIIIEAEDPEDDELSYSINDSRFIQDSEDENVFSWETEYDDEGNYKFKITVSDGDLTNAKDVDIEVKNKNQAPLCEEIPDLEWNEDETASFDLNLYCSDLDGDDLDFYVYNTSSETYISLDSLENGTVNFSSTYNWNGEDWIVFEVYDGKDSALTNEIILRVLSINDEPVFFRNIQNITWNEDVNLTNYLNLKNYFSDVDSELSFNVAGNNFINIIINNGLVSFSPPKDWYGTETIVFNANDGEFLISSNEIILTVNDVNEPPEFGEINCSMEILEDTSYTCQLSASDFENNSFEFSVVQENNLNCDINGENLEYTSKKDYNGQASCKIRVSDGYSYNDYLLEVNVLPVNDAPVITDSSPKGVVRLMKNISQEFRITASDVDGDALDVIWFLDGLEVGSGSGYIFNKDEGNYEVRTKVTDGEFEDEHTWNVFVGDISDFTCQEVSGFLCRENEFCRAENSLGVKDTANCCSVSCTPKFEKIKRCENLSEIEIEIKEPDEDDEFKIGETIKIKSEIYNNVNEDLDFDVEVYLYDLTKDKVIEKEKDSVKIDKDESKKADFEIKIPEDLDEEHEYAVFVKAIDDEEKYCNEVYEKIDIEREEDDVVIKEFKIEPETATCNDFIDLTIKIKNMGSEDEDVYVTVENFELKIKEKSEEFELERYDEDDEARKEFSVKIPQNASEGNYTIKANVFFNGEQNSVTKDLFLEECKDIETSMEEVEKIALGVEKKAVEVKENKNVIVIVLLVSMLLVLVAIIFLFYLIYKKSSI